MSARALEELMGPLQLIVDRESDQIWKQFCEWHVQRTGHEPDPRRSTWRFAYGAYIQGLMDGQLRRERAKRQ